ncbi:MAG: GtrA family protein [Rhodoglobus sp.]
MRRFVIQLSRFGAVGLIGLVVDVGVFNLLRATVLDASVLAEGPIIAKIISTMLAIAANYLGNRYWTFAATKRSTLLREGLEFVAVSIGGMLIALSCLLVSHYLLGFTSQLADNISSNGIGLVLGTAFRFAFYRYWVFHPNRERPLRAAEEPPVEIAAVESASDTTRAAVPSR